MNNSPEIQPKGPETGVESYDASREQLEKLRENAERGIESPRDADHTAEKARTEALESAVSVEAGSSERKKSGSPSPAARRGPISRKQKEASFKRRIKDVQAELTPSSRAFSKLIHNKAIEKTSDAVGGTIARPNAILAGAFMAFVLTLAVYVVAKNVGYRLSGFETIAAFAVGWTFGVIFDYLRVLITGKK